MQEQQGCGGENIRPSKLDSDNSTPRPPGSKNCLYPQAQPEILQPAILQRQVWTWLPFFIQLPRIINVVFAWIEVLIRTYTVLPISPHNAHHEGPAMEHFRANCAMVYS
jgi:hypothetical protein